MSLLNDIHASANEKQNTTAFINECVDLIKHIDEFIAENDNSLKLKEAMGRNYTSDDDYEVVDSGRHMADHTKELSDYGNKLEEVKQMLMVKIEKLKTMPSSPQKMKLWQHIVDKINQYGFEPEEFGFESA